MKKDKKKFKDPSPYVTRTIKRAVVNGVKIWLKAFQFRNLVRIAAENEIGYETVETGERKTLYFIVGGSDGSDRKIKDEKAAQMAFEQLKQFEQRQTSIK